LIDYIQTYEQHLLFIFDKFFPRFLYFAIFLSTFFFIKLLLFDGFFHPIIFNEYLSLKYKTITQHILIVHDLQLYSKLICSIQRQLKYLVDKQKYLINRDDCSDMEVQNSVLFITIFGLKINKCERYLKIKMLIFRFYNMRKKVSLEYELWISPITQA